MAEVKSRGRPKQIRNLRKIGILTQSCARTLRDAADLQVHNQHKALACVHESAIGLGNSFVR